MTDHDAPRVVVITGGGTGLGAATAHRLAQRGDHVHVAGRREERVAAVAAQIVAAGGVCHAHALDVTRPEQCRRLVGDVVAAEGRLDVLVNNAGVFRRGSACEADLGDWQTTLDINLTGALLMAQAAVEAFRGQPAVEGVRGQVLNVNSGAGLSAYREGAAYTASKFGLIGLSDALRQEVAPYGIKVTDVVVAAAVQSELSSRTGVVRLPAGTVAQVVADVLAMPGAAVVSRVDLTQLPSDG